MYENNDSIMTISVEAQWDQESASYTRTVSTDITIHELLEVFKQCALALTYTENTWNVAIRDAVYRLDD